MEYQLLWLNFGFRRKVDMMYSILSGYNIEILHQLLLAVQVKKTVKNSQNEYKIHTKISAALHTASLIMIWQSPSQKNPGYAPVSIAVISTKYKPSTHRSNIIFVEL